MGKGPGASVSRQTSRVPADTCSANLFIRLLPWEPSGTSSWKVDAPHPPQRCLEDNKLPLSPHSLQAFAADAQGNAVTTRCRHQRTMLQMGPGVRPPCLLEAAGHFCDGWNKSECHMLVTRSLPCSRLRSLYSLCLDFFATFWQRVSSLDISLFSITQNPVCLSRP